MEELVSENYVYPGSNTVFDSELAVPKRQKRFKQGKDGEVEIIFDEYSFHATPYKHIALAYTYYGEPFEIAGMTAHYNMGVSLYENNKAIFIYGVGSLEESLEKMYSSGGYLYYFEKDKFFHKEGLGTQEVISSSPIKPLKQEYIKDPVKEMKALGVTFKFVDISLPENEKFRNYF